MQRSRAPQIAIICVLISAAGLSGCGKRDAAKKEIVGYVNKEPVTSSDLKKELALRVKQDPAFKFTPETEGEQLELIINKKLIIQEAIKNGLAREGRFIDTIKDYWEQTLIRDFLAFKMREFRAKARVTDDEVKAYYANLGEKVNFKVLKSKNKKYVDDVYAEFINSKDSEIIPWDDLGMVGYDELLSPSLQDAFSMPAGQAKKYEEEPYYLIVMVSAREPKAVEPLDAIRKDVEKRILGIKERRLFEEWLLKERKKASIKLKGYK